MSDAEVSQEAEGTPSVEETGATPQPEGATPVEASDAKYNFEVEGKNVEVDRDIFNHVLRSTLNAEKWERKYHDKGKDLNNRLKEIETKEKNVQGNESLLNEYRTLRSAMQANPQAWDVVNNLLNSQQPKTDPKIKEIEGRLEKLQKDNEYNRTVTELSQRFPDFKEDEIMEFASAFNFNDPHDLHLFAYYAQKGMKSPDLVAEARADVVREQKKKKGLPSVGKKVPMPEAKPKDLDAWATEMKAKIRRGELKI
jgi:hypothetical protein